VLRSADIIQYARARNLDSPDRRFFASNYFRIP
jgi:hypothetical protein